MDGALIEILAVALIWFGLVPCREAEGVDGVLAAAPADLGGLVGVFISGGSAGPGRELKCEFIGPGIAQCYWQVSFKFKFAGVTVLQSPSRARTKSRCSGAG